MGMFDQMLPPAPMTRPPGPLGGGFPGLSPQLMQLLAPQITPFSGSRASGPAGAFGGSPRGAGPAMGGLGGVADIFAQLKKLVGGPGDDNVKTWDQDRVDAIMPWGGGGAMP